MKSSLLPPLLTLLFWATAATTVWSQNTDDYEEDHENMFIFFNDSTSQGWVNGDEWTITFTNKDTLDQLHTFPIGIKLENAIYSDTAHIALQTIDSILCQTPSPIVADNVYFLTEQHFPYIVESDTVSTLVFDTRGQEHFRLPTKGQKIYCDVDKHPLLPAGFIGKVEHIEWDNARHRVKYICSPIYIEDIYDRLYSTKVYQNKTSGQVKGKAARAISVDDPLFGAEFKETLKYDDFGIAIKDELTCKIDIINEQIIDKEKDLTTETMQLNIGFSNDLFIGVNGEFEGAYDKRLIRSPTIWIRPTLGIYGEVGFFASYKFSGQANQHLIYPYSFGWKFVRCGNNWTFQKTSNKPSGSNNNNNIFGFDNPMKMSISFEGALGVYFDFGLSLFNVATTSLRTHVGLGFQTKLEYDDNNYSVLAGTDKKDSPEHPNFKLREARYKALSGMPPTSLDINVNWSMLMQVPNGYEINLFDFINFEPKMSFNLRNWVWAPKVDYEKLDQDNFNYRGRLHWYGSPVADIRTGCYLVDVSNYEDKSMKYITNDHPAPPIEEKTYRGSYNAVDELLHDFNIHLDDPKFHWAGKRWGVYPYFDDPLFKYAGPGKIASFYIPYSIRTDNPYVTHQGVTLKGSVDPRFKNDPTQKLLLYLTSPQLTEKGEDVIFIDKSYISDNGQIEYYIPYNELPGNHKYYWRCWSTTENEFNESAECEFKGVEVEMPTTLEPKEVTESTARLMAQLCPSFFDYYADKKVIYGFEYAEGGLIDIRPTTQQFVHVVSKYENIDPYYFVEVKNLKPNTYYNVRAFVITPDNKKVKDVNTVSFKTTSPFLDITASVDYSGANITATLSDKVSYSDKSTVTFQIADDKAFKNIVRTMVKDKSTWLADNAFGLYYWSVEGRAEGLLHSQPYYCRAILKQPDREDIFTDVNSFTLPNAFEMNMVSATCEGNKGHFKGKVTNHVVKNALTAPNENSIYFQYSSHSDFSDSQKVRPKLDKKVLDNEGMSFVDLEVDVEDLAFDKKYYVRLVYEEPEDLEESNVKTFRTPNPYGCTTIGAQVEDATVILRGKLDSYALDFFHSFPSTTVYTAFDITPQGLDINEEYVRVKSEHLDVSTGEFTAEVILDPNTTYFFRALVYGENATHPSSQVLSFTTMDYDPDLIPLAKKKKILKFKKAK